MVNNNNYSCVAVEVEQECKKYQVIVRYGHAKVVNKLTGPNPRSLKISRTRNCPATRILLAAVESKLNTNQLPNP